MWRIDALQFLVALGVDALLGDPRGLPHLARGAGWLCWIGEPAVSRVFGRGIGAGAVFWVGVCGVALGGYAAVWAFCQWLGSPWAWLLEVGVVYQAVAARDLARHAEAVLRPLERGDLAEARFRLSWIVGRDTEGLDVPEISRAAIESVAESISDGIVAPLFWAALLGAPGALLYRVSNTLDSLVGHRTERYERFGKVSARIDDALNWIPARLVAVCFWLLRPSISLTRIQAEAGRHASPNAGWPEAAMAQVLGVRLGGVNQYDGVPSHGPQFNDVARPATPADLASSVRWMWRVTLLSAAGLGAALLAIA
jgi:adenosylcobinamide-phosphate synthase